jgi:hypothetical protein
MNGSEGRPCARYEMTQRQFRRLRGEQWSPSFISKFGKCASKLYREIYGKEPRQTEADDDEADLDLVNLYPRGILEQVYQRLIAGGEQIGEPYRKPDPSLKLKEPTKVVRPTRVRESFSPERSKQALMKKVAERNAKLAAGWRPGEDDDGLEDFMDLLNDLR